MGIPYETQTLGCFYRPGNNFLNEELSWQLAVGSLLIFVSILVVNWKTK
jgi:hypothetical protein